MIKLNVQPYCHNCPEFEANVEKESVVADDFYQYDIEKTIYNTDISCKHRDRCVGMVEYLRCEIDRRG